MKKNVETPEIFPNFLQNRSKKLYNFRDPVSGVDFLVVRNPKETDVSRRRHSTWGSLWIGPKLIPLPNEAEERRELLKW